MTRRHVVQGLLGATLVFIGGRPVLADFVAPTTADPIDDYTATIGINYNQVQTFTEPLLYDSNFNPEPDVYWFKYVSDGKTAVTFDTLGTNISTGAGGFTLPSTNETQIAVYNSAGGAVGISKGVVDSSGNPIEIAKFFNEPEPPPKPLPTDYYYPEELSQVTFAPNAPSDPKWDVNPNDPNAFTGWTAPDNPGNGQKYYPPDYPTSLNEYHVWSTALSHYVLNDDGSDTLSGGSPIVEDGWRYGDYAQGGLAANWNQFNALPTGTYYIAVSSVAIVFNGDTYGEQLLEAPIHYDLTGNEPNNGHLPEITQPLGTWQYYDDPSSNSFYGTIQLNVTESPATLQYEWLTDGDGNWSNSANWGGPIPNGAGDTANFLNANTAPRTITLDVPVSLAHLVFNSAYQYTLAGSQTLTLDNGSNPADVIIDGGSHFIAAPLVVASNATIIAYQSTSLSINGSLSIGAGLTLTKLGAGSLTIGGIQDNAAGSALYVGEGTATIATDPGSNLALTSAADVIFPASTTTGIRAIHLASLSITTQGLVNGTVTFAGPGTGNESNRTVLVTSALNFTGTSSIGWVGQLDLGGNDAIIHNGNLAQVTNQIASGFNASGGGYWNGPGIISSTAAADTTHLTALGVMLNSTTGGTAIYSTFDQVPVTSTDVLIKYTYYGDANLSGAVDASDYSLIDNGYLNHLTGWSNGDFNYDGVVNGSDYTLIDNAYNTQGAVIESIVAQPTVQVAAVPEPASLCVLSLVSLALLSRRRNV